MVFGYLRFKQLGADQAMTNLKTSIAGSSTSGSNSYIKSSGNDGDESSSDDDDF